MPTCVLKIKSLVELRLECLSNVQKHKKSETLSLS